MVFWYLIVTKGAVVLAVLLYIFAKYGINFNSSICVDVIIIFFAATMETLGVLWVSG